jgi:hypothetical protein
MWGAKRRKGRALSSALEGNDYGCFVPDLTRFAMPQCEGARRVEFYQASALFSSDREIIHVARRIETCRSTLEALDLLKRAFMSSSVAP